ncbi:MAG: HYR domain-containing protein, partial [Chitinophagaceae bacterium]
ATVTITVNAVNDQPVGVDDAATVNEDAVLNGSVRGNDTESGDGGNSWTVVTTTTHGVLILNTDGTYTYTPAPNFHGTDVFTYQVCDADGDCSTATVTISVNSVDDAGIILVKDITVYLDATGNVSITPGQVDDGSYDPDGIASITIDQSNFTCANVGANNVTMTVTDVNGNISTAVAIVTVMDNIAPVISCPAPVTVTCDSAVPVPNPGSVVVSDNCSAVVSWTGDVISNQQGLNKYTITRTYKATDPSGNTASCTQQIIVQDLIAPVLTGVIPGSAELQCIAEVPGAPDAAVIATQFTDNCSGTVTAVLSNTSTTGDNANGWTVTYAYTISDASGNTTIARVIYTGKDTQAPVPVIAQLPTVTGECAATVTVPVAMDNCGGTILGTTASPLHYTAQGTYFIEWSFNDGNGNVSTQSQTVVVKDVTPPVVSCPADITVNASVIVSGQGGAYVTYAATASDNCGTPVVSYSITPGSFFPIGSTPVTVTAVDAKGNTSTCTFTVTVGCVNPVISVKSVPANNTFTGGIPTNLFLGYGAQSTVLQVTAPAGSTYVWSGNGVNQLSSTSSANPVFTPTAGGSYTFVVTVTNTAGCATTASITICVTDIRVPGSNLSSDDDDDHGDRDDHDDDNDDDHQRMCNHSAHSSSNCSHKGHNHTCDHKSHSKYNCAHRGTNDRDDDDQKDCDHKSHSYKDCSHKGHNHASCNHKAHSASDCEHERNHGNNQKVCNHQSHSASDCSHAGHHHGSCSHTSHSSSNCSHGDDDDDDDDNDHHGNGSGNYKVFLCHVPPGNPGKTITLSISINAVAAHLSLHPGDRLGSCDQQPCTGYTDNVKPVINCPENIVVSCGASTLPAATGKATATDNSGTVTVTVTYSDVTNGNIITRTWKATDGTGNVSTSTQTISIVDNVQPVITDPADITVNCGASTLPAATGTATATDNCSATIITYTDATNGNIITRTWKATDAAGNYKTAIQLITVGTPFTTSITSVPTSSTYTGGVATNLYLGYGAQSTKLQVGSLPSAGVPYTYVWTGSYVNRLSSSSAAAPVFTPATFGYYSFTVTVTNKYGCKSIASINICVTDIRVPGCGGSKVYMTHTTTGKYGRTQTIEVPVNQVSSHLSSSSCGSNGQDRLGSADQSPCNTTVQNSVVANTATATKESGIETATTEEELKVTVLPNPSTTYFTLKLESKYTTPVNLRVMDGSGRVVDARSKLGANSTLQIGHNYSSGTYYAEMIQGTQRKVVQLIKGRG